MPMIIPLKYGVSIDTQAGTCISPNAELYQFPPDEIIIFLQQAKEYTRYARDIETIEWFWGHISGMKISDIAKNLEQCPEVLTAMSSIGNNPLSNKEEKDRIEKLFSAIDEFKYQDMLGRSLKRQPHPSLREKVIHRDGGKCRYCGQKVTGKIYLDHVVPYALGGKTNIDNLVTTCFSCNSKKGSKTPEQIGMHLTGDTVNNPAI